MGIPNLLAKAITTAAKHPRTTGAAAGGVLGAVAGEAAGDSTTGGVLGAVAGGIGGPAAIKALQKGGIGRVTAPVQKTMKEFYGATKKVVTPMAEGTRKLFRSSAQKLVN